MFTALTELWREIWSLEWPLRRLLIAGVLFVVILTILAWRVMAPLLLVAVLVALYLRYSRPSDSL